MIRFSRCVVVSLALTGMAWGQSPYAGQYRLTGSFDDGRRTRVELEIRPGSGGLELVREASTPAPTRWTAVALAPATGQPLRALYRVAPAGGIADALSASTPAPDNLFLATYRLEQGQLTEEVVNFTRRGGARWSRIEAAARAALPAQVRDLRDRVLAIAAANTTNKDGVRAVRDQLDPLLAQLGRYYADHRPVDEVALTRGVWKSLWYDDPDIDASEGFAPLDRTNIYQVILDGAYYNVSNSSVRLFGKRLFSTHAFLKGNYAIARPASATTQGEPRRNVIDLEFDVNRARLGKIPTDRSLLELTRAVDGGDARTIRIPGPRGITGELWNVYLDEDVRISFGVQDDNGVQDVYILRRTDRAGPLPQLP